MKVTKREENKKEKINNWRGNNSSEYKLQQNRKRRGNQKQI
jgi:hypothetical protein